MKSHSAKPRTEQPMSDEMLRLIRESRDADQRIAAGRQTPPAESLQRRMQSGVGSVEPETATPFEQLTPSVHKGRKGAFLKLMLGIMRTALRLVHLGNSPAKAPHE